MNTKIELFNYVFELKISEEKVVTSCSFNIMGRLPASLTEDELKRGYIIQQEIFSGKWDWLIFHKGLITLSEFKMDITLNDPVYNGSLRWRGGNIVSELKEVCPYCEEKDCNFDCENAQKWACIKDSMSCQEKYEELEGNRNYNIGCDVIESMVLAHAIAGINVESEMYKEGIRTALDALGNNT